MEYELLAPGDLKLDRQNPRFGLSEAVSEPQALEMLVESADLKELWDSIAERGFEKFEPLVATRENNELVVLEGNRRLAAVKLLLDPTLLAQESLRKRIPILDREKLKTCEKLPVVIVADRRAADGYIGFKHVNGPARWSSLAKAKFGVDLYERLNASATPYERMASLTKQLGDSRGLIIRLLVGYKIIQQCIHLGYLEALEVDENSIEFSHLYTLINNPDSRDFIGLQRSPLSETLIRDNPVPDTHLDELRQLLSWLYGKNSVIKAQGTDRPRLQRVIASKEALQELKRSGNLDQAETVSEIKNDEWLRLLAKISTMATTANSAASVVVPELAKAETEEAEKIIKRIQIQIKQINSVFE